MLRLYFCLVVETIKSFNDFLLLPLATIIKDSCCNAIIVDKNYQPPKILDFTALGLRAKTILHGLPTPSFCSSPHYIPFNY